MEANRQSLVSRIACVGLVALWLVPIIEYFGGMEPARKPAILMLFAALRRDHPPWLMLVWLIPPLLGVLRLGGVAWGQHARFAAVGVFLGISELFLAWGPQNPSLAKAQVYFGIEGVVPAVHWGLHAALAGGISAAWFFDELWAQREFKPLDR